ncbi:hypothetical protein GGS21DRAFT_490864 [Xylaria nigripes]|nr:hypothetical protein GGS21DRAFT_490864 [Xylaria nigripes]
MTWPQTLALERSDDLRRGDRPAARWKENRVEIEYKKLKSAPTWCSRSLLSTYRSKDQSPSAHHLNLPRQIPSTLTTTTMQIVRFFSVLACAIATASAVANIGQNCDAPATYDCTLDGKQIAVCDGVWRLAADCAGGSCYWDDTRATPLCRAAKA